MAAFGFSFTGFGFNLVAVTLLALVLPIKMAVVIQLPFSVLLPLLNSGRYGRKFSWVEVKPLFIGAIIAIPLGVFSLDWFSESIMKRALAGFIVLTVFSARCPWKGDAVNRFASSPSGGTLLGMISGWFMGAYTTGGPPAVIYATAIFSDEKKAKGLMGTYFFLVNLTLMILFWYTGLMTVDTLKQSFVHSPAVIAGFLLGTLLLKQVSHEGYMMGVHFLLLVAAVTLSIGG